MRWPPAPWRTSWAFPSTAPPKRWPSSRPCSAACPCAERRPGDHDGRRRRHARRRGAARAARRRRARMIELVSALKRASRGEVLRDVPLAPRTSVRVGGTAQLWVRPRDPEALVAVLGVLCDAGVPWFALRGGARTPGGAGGVGGGGPKLSPALASQV